jgi:alanyl aminopeptidase
VLRGLALLLVFFCVSCTTREAARPSVVATWPIIREVPTLRLPPGVTPVSQQLELTIDPYADWYTGRTEIEVDIAIATSIIWLNGHDLRVGSVTVTPAGGAALRADYTEHDGSGFASIRTLEPIPAGRARIALGFGARLGDGSLGLYRREDEEKRRYVFTQLEPISARTVFPCFDEPGFKIPLDVTLVVPRGMRAASNGRELSRTPHARGDRLQFATTAKLPVYLVTIAVGPFDVVDAPPAPANAVRAVPLALRVFTPRASTKGAGNMMRIVAPLLAELEAYTGTPYPYGKLDIIVEPRKPGAMEGAGAITIGTFLLLGDDPDEFKHRRRDLVEMMSHELAHMWVGNLVTLAWWDDVWLNEAFASWLGAKAAHAFEADLGVEGWMAFKARFRLQDDENGTERAIREPIASEKDIEDAFDHLVYEKGAGVLTMFERWAGADVWQRGFRDYLQRHAHGHATTADFGRAMTLATGTDVETALKSFLDNRGVPVVSFALRCSQNGSGAAHVALSQTAYAPIGAAPAELVWGIPVCVRYGGKASGQACTLLRGREGTLPLAPDVGCPAWILPNPDGAGYYRSSLARADRLALGRHALGALDWDEKHGYLENLRADYRRGALPFGDAIEAVADKSMRPDAQMVMVAMDLLGEARSFLLSDPLREHVERHVRALYRGALDRIGYNRVEREALETSRLRWPLMEGLARVGRDTRLRSEAKRRGIRYLASAGSSVSEDKILGTFWGWALSVVAEDGDRAALDVLVRKYEAAEEFWQQRHLARALGNVRAPGAVARILASASIDRLIYTQMDEVMIDDTPGADLASISWAWLTANDDLLPRLVQSYGAMQINNVVERLCDEAPIRQAEQLIGPIVAADEKQDLSDAIARARMCVAARKVHEPEMRAYFQSK